MLITHFAAKSSYGALSNLAAMQHNTMDIAATRMRMNNPVPISPTLALNKAFSIMQGCAFQEQLESVFPVFTVFEFTDF